MRFYSTQLRKTEDYNSSSPLSIPPLGDYCKPSFNSFFLFPFKPLRSSLFRSTFGASGVGYFVTILYFFTYVAQLMREAEPVGVVHVVLFITFYLK